MLAHAYNSNSPAGRTAKSPPATCRIAPAAEDEAAVPELVAEAEPDAEAEADVLLSPSNDVSVVKVAVTPVELVQSLGTEDVLPSTKLTAAHYAMSVQKSDLLETIQSYLVEISIDSTLGNLYDSLLSDEGLRH